MLNDSASNDALRVKLVSKATAVLEEKATRLLDSSIHIFGFLQVIGPMPAQRWLAEADQALQLRYHFVHCKDFDASGSPSRLWLMSMTGTSPFIMLEIFTGRAYSIIRTARIVSYCLLLTWLACCVEQATSVCIHYLSFLFSCLNCASNTAVCIHQERSGQSLSAVTPRKISWHSLAIGSSVQEFEKG